MFTVEKVIREFGGEKREIKFLAGLGNLTQDVRERRVNTQRGETFVVGGYDREFGRPPAIAFDYWVGEEKKAVYYQLEAWGRTAELLGRFGRKGVEVSVYGRVEERRNKNPKSGKEYINEALVVERFKLTSRNDKIGEKR